VSKLWSRRGFLALTGSVALLTACGSTESGKVAKDGSVTVEHAFGTTRIPAPPQRVVSAGLTEQDDLLAVGVVPVAVTDWFGDEPSAVWPWARDRLGGATPEVLSLADGIEVDRIAALAPDLIVATNAGLDEQTYARLSEIAPTVAQPGPEAFFGPWQAQATIIGQAVFKADEMAGIVADVENRFTGIADQYPGFAGRRVALLAGRFDGDGIDATPPGWRTEFLTAMGFEVADLGTRVPREELADALDGLDVLIWTTADDAERAALEADPAIAGRPNVFCDKELTGAIAFASPLSYPVVADRLPPLLDAALS